MLDRIREIGEPQIGESLMSGREQSRHAAWLRYALFQIPGFALTAVALYAAVEWADLPAGVAWLLLFAWVAKDIAMYRAVRVAYQPGPPHGSEALVGSCGVALGPLEPDGWVRIGAERWRARVAAPNRPVPGGTPVRVRAVDGFTLMVEAEEC